MSNTNVEFSLYTRDASQLLSLKKAEKYSANFKNFRKRLTNLRVLATKGNVYAQGFLRLTENNFLYLEKRAISLNDRFKSEFELTVDDAIDNIDISEYEATFISIDAATKIENLMVSGIVKFDRLIVCLVRYGFRSTKEWSNEINEVKSCYRRAIQECGSLFYQLNLQSTGFCSAKNKSLSGLTIDQQIALLLKSPKEFEGLMKPT